MCYRVLWPRFAPRLVREGRHIVYCSPSGNQFALHETLPQVPQRPDKSYSKPVYAIRLRCKPVRTHDQRVMCDA